MNDDASCAVEYNIARTQGRRDNPPRHEWMTNPHMRTVIGEKEQVADAP